MNKATDDCASRILDLERWLAKKLRTSRDAIGNQLSICASPSETPSENCAQRCFPRHEASAALNLERKRHLLAQLVRFENERFFMGLKRDPLATELRVQDLSSAMPPVRIDMALVSEGSTNDSADDIASNLRRTLNENVAFREFAGLPRGWAILFATHSFERVEFFRSGLSATCERMTAEQYDQSWRHSDRRVYREDEIQELIEDHVCLTLRYEFSFRFERSEGIYLLALD